MSKGSTPTTINTGDAPSAGRGVARILVVEDQRLVAEFLALHCRSIGLAVLGICATAQEGLRRVRAEHPDLVLMDFSLPDGSGLEVAQVIMRELPATRVLGISSHRDPWTMLQVQRLGLHGFVDKHDPQPEELTRAIQAVLNGHTYYTQMVNEATASLRRDPHAFIRVLSDYEIRILAMIGQSQSDEEIAAALAISASTVQSRRRDIMKKLDIHTTPKLIHFAIVNGLTRPEQLSQPPP